MSPTDPVGGGDAEARQGAVGVARMELLHHNRSSLPEITTRVSDSLTTRMSYPKASFLFLPYTRLEVPGWGHLYSSRLVRGYDRDAWHGAPTRIIRGKLHHLEMELDLSDWSDRLTYFLGRYYELGIQLLLLECVEHGDRVVDVGANVGLVTLLLAWLVGETGAVEAFEPNPDALGRLRRQLERNRIGWVRVFPFALGDKAGRLELKVADDHTGVGTLGVLDGPQHNITSRHTVDVEIGDEVLLPRAAPIKLMKIDVEGFECRVLTGIERAIQRDHPIVITEASEALLARAGDTLRDMFNLMGSFGYRAHRLGTRRNWWLRYRLDLHSVTSPNEVSTPDLLWIYRDDHRLDALLQQMTS